MSNFYKASSLLFKYVLGTWCVFALPISKQINDGYVNDIALSTEERLLDVSKCDYVG